MCDPVDLLGVGIRRLTVDGLIGEAIRRADAGAKSTLLYANIHVLNTAYRDADLRRILNLADVVYCDGAGVKLGARLLGYRLPERMTGADWIEPLCAECAKRGTMLYLMGGAPGVAARAAERLQARYPGLPISGAHHGFLFEPKVSTQAVESVNAARPHILLVGMGTPIQEKWIAAHREQLNVPVVWAVGALFDFVAGVQPRGPRWMLDHGLEWLCRLLSDPGRLWKRYVIGNPLFVGRVLLQRISKSL